MFISGISGRIFLLMAIEKFTVNVPDSVFIDLNRRLDATRWPDELQNAAWDYGSSFLI